MGGFMAPAQRHAFDAIIWMMAYLGCKVANLVASHYPGDAPALMGVGWRLAGIVALLAMLFHSLRAGHAGGFDRLRVFLLILQVGMVAMETFFLWLIWLPASLSR